MIIMNELGVTCIISKSQFKRIRNVSVFPGSMIP
jgi:hypothetical protein